MGPNGQPMNQAEFEALQTTFPWREQTVVVNGVGGIVRVLDRNGAEVPIFTMTRFLSMITAKLVKQPTTPEKEAA